MQAQQHKKTLGNQEAEFASELSSMKQLHEQSLCDMRTQHQLQLSDLQNGIQAHQTEIQLEQSRLAQQHQAELSCQLLLSQKSAAESAQLLSHLRAEHDQELSELQSQHLDQIQRLLNESQQRECAFRQEGVMHCQELEDIAAHYEVCLGANAAQVCGLPAHFTTVQAAGHAFASSGVALSTHCMNCGLSLLVLLFQVGRSTE